MAVIHIREVCLRARVLHQAGPEPMATLPCTNVRTQPHSKVETIIWTCCAPAAANGHGSTISGVICTVNSECINVALVALELASLLREHMPDRDTAAPHGSGIRCLRSYDIAYAIYA
jgi:hypothetical protein